VPTPVVSTPTPVAAPVMAAPPNGYGPSARPAAAEMPAGNGGAPLGVATSGTATSAAPAGIGAPVNGAALPPPSRLLVVEIRASGNWKETCRQSVKLAERYQGNAGLRLQLAGQDLVMDFPERRIDCAIELVEALERLPGVGRVYEC